MNPALAARLREAAKFLADDIPPGTPEIQDLDGDVRLDELDLYVVNLMREVADGLAAIGGSSVDESATQGTDSLASRGIGSPLDGVARSIRHHLANLKYRSTGRDPKNNGFAFAEVPDWALRQWLRRIEDSRGITLVSSEVRPIIPSEASAGNAGLDEQSPSPSPVEGEVVEPLKDLLSLIHSVCPEYDEATVCANARAVIARVEGGAP